MKLTCLKCKEEKDIDQFNKDARRPFGVRNTCRTCQKSYFKKYYQTPEAWNRRIAIRYADKFRSESREYSRRTAAEGKRKLWDAEYSKRPEVKERAHLKYLRMIAKHPLHFKIRNEVHKMIRRKIIPSAKELGCLDCGNQAHNYHHPLEYKWEFRFVIIPVCIQCHAKRHRRYE